jgi:hypothetical protein
VHDPVPDDVGRAKTAADERLLDHDPIDPPPWRVDLKLGANLILLAEQRQPHRSRAGIDDEHAHRKRETIAAPRRDA